MINRIPNIQKLLLLTLIFLPQLLFSQSYTYTSDDDFDKGTLIGLEHDTVPDQLQLTKESDTFPFIWVPNSNEGTVSKIDTKTGAELGRYRTSPLSSANPSRTTVDIDGNCWVGNRFTGTVVKIGLFENGQYKDRNNNGTIETSQDLNGDGDIAGGEILPWGDDECVLYEIIVIQGIEGTYAPGEYTGLYANDDWNPGPRGFAVDSMNNLWAGTYGTMKYYYIDGETGQILKTLDVSSVNHTAYGAIMDAHGILWSSGQNKNHLLCLNPIDDSFTTVAVGHFVYGLGIDKNDHLFVSGWEWKKLSRINVLTGIREWTKNGYHQSRGVAVTDDGDVWVANSWDGTVTRWSNDGIIEQNIYVGNTPTGVAVDAEGKVWVVNAGDEYVKRIDPSTNKIDLEKRIIGGYHYGYSDMTGIIARTITTNIGTWTVVHNAENENTSWGTISWNSYEPAGTLLKTRVRSSNDREIWSSWQDVVNSVPLTETPDGRYLQIEVTLQIESGDVSPILYDLTVTPAKGANCGYFYPNPYNPDREIGHFVLCEPGETTIDIFDGSNSHTITLKVTDQTIIQVPWDGKNSNEEVVSNGVYFYIIKPTSGENIVGKIGVTK